MSEDPIDKRDGVSIGAEELFARAAAADRRAHRALAVAIDDFFLPELDRLDERTRSTMTVLLRSVIMALETDIADYASQLLAHYGETQLMDRLAARTGTAFKRVSAAGLLRDPELTGELLARVRQEAIAANLPLHASEDPERPSLINRLVQHPDEAIATSAMAVLLAESRRRARAETGRIVQNELPAHLHHRVAWWVSAAIRDNVADPSAALDLSLCEAAQRSLATYEGVDRPEDTAERFAALLNATRQELPHLLIEALGDRRLVLFIALFGHAARLPYVLARDLVIDPAGDRLWLALRALELPRTTIAQIGYALCEADPRRNLETFAAMLDTIMAVEANRAQEALVPLRLDPQYRAALRVLRG